MLVISFIVTSGTIACPELPDRVIHHGGEDMLARVFMRATFSSWFDDSGHGDVCCNFWLVADMRAKIAGNGHSLIGEMHPALMGK